jgi:hypothetical protein
MRSQEGSSQSSVQQSYDEVKILLCLASMLRYELVYLKATYFILITSSRLQHMRCLAELAVVISVESRKKSS